MALKNKRYMLIVTTIIFTICLILPQSVSAQTTSYMTVGGKKVTYYHIPQKRSSRHKVFHGIDVSVYQKNVDWNRVKKSGVDFAFVRCGGTWGRSDFGQYHDGYCESNVRNAQAAGMNVGLYYFSLPINMSEAKREADFAIAKARACGLKNGAPIIMDYEFLPGSRMDRTYKDWVSKKGVGYARTRTSRNAVTFMKRIKSAGYKPVFYSYRNITDWNPKFDMSRINGNNQYSFWLAQYSTNNSYPGNVEFWQYTSKGTVSGVTGNCDRNFWYMDSLGQGTEPGKKSIRDVKFKVSHSSMKYSGKPLEPSVLVKHGNKTLTENKDYTIGYYKNVRKGTAYIRVNGVGDYSNDILLPFSVSDVNVANDKFTEGDGIVVPEVVPDKVKNLDYKVADDKVTFTFDKAKDAVDYAINYRKNGSSIWQTAYTGGENSYRMPLERGEFAEVRVRAEGAFQGTGQHSDYTKTKSVLNGQVNARSGYSSRRNLFVVRWSNIKEPVVGAEMKYMVKWKYYGGKTHRAFTNQNSYTIKNAKLNGLYEFKIVPVLRMGDGRYVGEYGKYSRRFARKCGDYVVTPKKGYADFRYIANDFHRMEVEYADNPYMKAYTRVSSDRGHFYIRNLKSGKKYYFRARTVRIKDGKKYRSPYGTIKSAVIA